jgi:Macrocin-O-methyltransferase (TylF)
MNHQNDLHPSGTDAQIREWYDRKDDEFWNDLEQAVEDNGLRLRDVLKWFAAYVRRRDLPTVLARYDLFKHVIDLPGCIVELGVQYGSGLFLWSKLLETFCPGDRTRMVYGFDTFSGFGELHEKDGDGTEWKEKRVGGLAAPASIVEILQELHTRDNYLSGVARSQLIKGDISETVPQFIRENPGMRISLVNFDCDMYAPTMTALEQLYPLVIKGGVVIFDEYATAPWEGESKAFEEFFNDMGARPVMKKFAFSQTPHAYFIKQ